MANLTVTIDEHVLKRARIRALEQGTSVNSLVADYLTRYADLDDAQMAMRQFLERARRSGASSGPEGRTWRREDLYDL
jgi:hypothetical protein